MSSIAVRWGEPVRVAARKAATETQDREVLWLGESPNAEKRETRLRHSGRAFFWSLFVSRAKKS
ncbi:MAG TPA: hypothetical protein VGA88_01135, partial [Burkholderiales bacterium]